MRLTGILVFAVLLYAAPAARAGDARPDLAVTHVSRSPRYPAFDVKVVEGVPIVAQPGTLGTEQERLLTPAEAARIKRDPSPAEAVLFTARVRNLGTAPSGPFEVAWTVDGKEAGRASHPGLDPGRERDREGSLVLAGGGPLWDGQPAKGSFADFELKWAWKAGPHEVAVEADPSNTVDEECEGNNRVSEATQGRALLVAITKQHYADFLPARDPEYGPGFEGWVLRHRALLRNALAASKHPGAPRGVELAVRLEGIFVSPDAGASAHARRWGCSSGFDGVWAFPGSLPLPIEPGKDCPAAVGEWVRAVGLPGADVLAIDPWANRARTGGGSPAFLGHPSPFLLRPGGEPPLPEIAAVLLNRMQESRGGGGNVFLFQFPRASSVRVLDAAGAAVAGASLRFFQARGGRVGEEADLAGRTDRAGRYRLANRPAAASAPETFPCRDTPYGRPDLDGGNGVFFVEIEARGHCETRWLPATDFLVRAAPGAGAAEVEWATRIPPDGAPPAPTEARCRGCAGGVEIAWSPVEGAAGYRVWWAGAAEGVFRPISTPGAGQTRFVHRLLEAPEDPPLQRYAVTAVGPDGVESAFAPAGACLLPRSPASLVFLQDGRILALDAGHGRPAQLDAAGRALGPLCPETETFAALDGVLDPAGDPVILHAGGKGAETKHALARLDFDGRVKTRRLFDEGAAADRMRSPRGLAVDRSGNVLVADGGNHRILVLKPDFTPLGRYGEEGEEPGALREPARLAFDANGSLLAVADRGNRRVQVFQYSVRKTGEPLFSFAREIAVPEGPADVAFGPDGGLAVASGARVLLFGAEGESVRGAHEKAGDRAFTALAAVAFDGAGALWALDAALGAVRVTEGTGDAPGAEAVVFPMECRWRLGAHDYAHYRKVSLRDAKGDPENREETFRLFGLFGNELAEGRDATAGVVNAEEIAHALAATLPARKLSPGARERFAAEFGRLRRTFAVQARGEWEVLGASTIRGIPCVRWKGSFDLAERGKDFRQGPTLRLTGGRVEVDAHFRPDLGVLQEVRLEYRIAREGGDGKEQVESGLERLSYLKTFGHRYAGFEEDVNRAIERGASFLLGRQKAEGEFGAHYDYKTGPTALALLTLVKSGVDPSQERIRKGFDWLLARPFEKTYEVGLSIMALEARATPPAEADLLRRGLVKKYVRTLDPAQREWMKSAVDWLTEKMLDQGWWGYPTGAGDFSNTQYAVLGLAAASRCDVEAPVAVWEAVSGFSLAAQESGGESFRFSLVPEGRGEKTAAGGFSGSRYARGWGYRPREWPYGSMTTSGLTCLIQAQAALEKLGSEKAGRERVKSRNARLDGFGWLASNWTSKANPGRFMANYYYFLYGLERACVLEGIREVQGHDWYWEGALQLLLRQEAGGSWMADRFRWLHDTCFALLFLKRATVPVISDH